MQPRKIKVAKKTLKNTEFKWYQPSMRKYEFELMSSNGIIATMAFSPNPKKWTLGSQYYNAYVQSENREYYFQLKGNFFEPVTLTDNGSLEPVATIKIGISRGFGKNPVTLADGTKYHLRRAGHLREIWKISEETGYELLKIQRKGLLRMRAKITADEAAVFNNYFRLLLLILGYYCFLIAFGNREF